MMQSVALTESTLNYHQEDDYVLVSDTAKDANAAGDSDDDESYDYCDDVSLTISEGPSVPLDFVLEYSPQEEVDGTLQAAAIVQLPPHLHENDVEEIVSTLNSSEIVSLATALDEEQGYPVLDENFSVRIMPNDREVRIHGQLDSDLQQVGTSMGGTDSTSASSVSLANSTERFDLRSKSNSQPDTPTETAPFQSDADSSSVVSRESTQTLKSSSRLGRLSNKKRRKQMKLAKKAAATAAAAAALSHVRTLTSRSSPSPPGPRSRTKVPPTPPVTSSRKKKQVAPAVAIARKTLKEYKKEVSTSPHRALVAR